MDQYHNKLRYLSLHKYGWGWTQSGVSVVTMTDMASLMSCTMIVKVITIIISSYIGLYKEDILHKIDN